MPKDKIRILIAALAMIWASMASAQEVILRPVTSSYMLEAGASHLADTYLTPLHYRGWHTAVRYDRRQAMGFDPQHWTMQLKLGFGIDGTENPAKNANMYSAMIDASWAMMWRNSLPIGVTWGVGPATSINAGALYLSRNGNNPASAKAAWTVDATAFASWSTKIWRIPVTFRYQPTMPLTGVFFSPDYGELYYQIYLGDHKGLVHTAWPGNYFMLDNMITADLHFGSTSLRIGYHNNIFSSKVNDIVSQAITNSIVIGITTEWISLRPNSKSINAKIISSY